jgi:ketosteroid isomerase-like protein
MSNVTPEEVLSSVTECINSGNLDSLTMLYESNACFASQPGQFIKGRDNIRQSMQGFVDRAS